MENKIQDLIDNYIYDNGLHSFLTSDYEANPNCYKEAMEFTKGIIDLLVYKNFLTDTSSSMHNQLLITSALLVFRFKLIKPLDIFKYRQELAKPMSEAGVDDGVAEYIYEILEAHLGDKTFVKKCAPIPNSPTQMFADAFYYYNYYKN